MEEGTSGGIGYFKSMSENTAHENTKIHLS